MRSGQAMVETTVIVSIIVVVLVALFTLAHALTGKILLQHAAMRAARARAVGYNDFMCLKAIRVSTIPVSGERKVPAGVRLSPSEELHYANKYLQTVNNSYAAGLLHYDKWDDLEWRMTDKGAETGLETEWFDLEGSAAVQPAWPFYMLEGSR